MPHIDLVEPRLARQRLERPRFHCGTGGASEATMPGPWSGWWLGIVTLRRPECSGGGGSNTTEIWPARSFHRLARSAAGCFKSHEPLAHDRAAAFGKGYIRMEGAKRASSIR
jgi:hypothetical protein